MELWNYAKSKHLHNYQTETTIFLTKHEKTVMACSYLNFPSHTENTPKQQKMVAFDFCEELISGNDFEAVLVVKTLRQFLLLWIYYSANSSEAVEKWRLAQDKDTAGDIYQLTINCKQLIS